MARRRRRVAATVERGVGTAQWPSSGRATRLPCANLAAAGAAGDGRAARPRVLQAAARLAPRPARGQWPDHVRVQREHQMANSDSPIARRRSRLAAPRRGMTPRARSSGRRSARWPAIRSSSRERVAVDFRRSPHCEIDENANAAGCVQQERELLLTTAPLCEARRARCPAAGVRTTPAAGAHTPIRGT